TGGGTVPADPRVLDVGQQVDAGARRIRERAYRRLVAGIQPGFTQRQGAFAGVYAGAAYDGARRTGPDEHVVEQLGGARIQGAPVFFLGGHGVLRRGSQRGGVPGVQADWTRVRAVRRGGHCHRSVCARGHVLGHACDARAGRAHPRGYRIQEVGGHPLGHLCADQRARRRAAAAAGAGHGVTRAQPPGLWCAEDWRNHARHL
ncbi:hypothetical protein EV174_003654, partial [Coemansia sp. RSA 2320]